MTAPRWRLIAAHYIHVIVDGQPSAWEYAEQSRETGRMIRVKHPTPLLSSSAKANQTEVTNATSNSSANQPQTWSR
jgi:hypothetical protein